MAIPENQLDTWSNQGAVVSSATAYAAVQNALNAVNSPVRLLDTDLYLQGSYRNHTNIYGDSDVDIVVQLNSSFDRNVSALPLEQQAAHFQAYPNATYLWEHFYGDVFQALTSYFGPGRVTPGSKAIKVQTGPGRMTADVVPALHFRWYTRFHSKGNEDFIEGISFRDSARNTIYNYPKHHIRNGEAKNSAARTNGWYKPTVRVFKNARAYLVESGAITPELAPSYFVECMVYNVPDNLFSANHQRTFVQSLNHLRQLPFTSYVSKNGLIPLFGQSGVQWSTESATAFLQAITSLWENW